jgi:hypothetical protein
MKAGQSVSRIAGQDCGFSNSWLSGGGRARVEYSIIELATKTDLARYIGQLGVKRMAKQAGRLADFTRTKQK